VCKQVTVYSGIYILKYSALFQVYIYIYTRWFKYARDYLCLNKEQFVPVIFEPPCKTGFGGAVGLTRKFGLATKGEKFLSFL
jgi:hypothetical protein